MVTIREGGRERKATAAEAFLLKLAKRGIKATVRRHQIGFVLQCLSSDDQIAQLIRASN
jgi:hypothetical protein